MRAIAVLTLVASLLSVPAELVPAASAAQVVVAPRRARAETPYAAIVDAKFAGADGTMIDSVPTYHTVGAALTGLPVNGGARTVISIRNGTYREKLTIDRPRVTLRGESRDRTVLTFDAVADTPAPGGGTYGTRGSFTLRIVAPDFRAEDLTIENAFDYAANAAKANDDPSKLKNPQGVALMLDLGSDRASIENCRILGHQDTLFTNAGRSYFHRTLIAGHVDFIFGAGQAVFDDCDMVSLDRGSKSNNGYITAPSTNVDAPYGLVFLHSRLKKENPSMAVNSVVLGRPWLPSPIRAPWVAPCSSIAGSTITSATGAGSACRAWIRRARASGTSRRVRASSSIAALDRVPQVQAALPRAACSATWTQRASRSRTCWADGRRPA